MRIPREHRLCLVLAALILPAAAFAATLGFLRIPLWDVTRVFAAKALFLPAPEDIDRAFVSALINIRLPRILAALLVGGALALCGAVFQALLLNPLADPYTLGVSTGSAFGASLAILLQVWGWAPPLPPTLHLPLFAFLGGMGTLTTFPPPA